MQAIKDLLSIRILTKLVTVGAGFAILLVALIWTRASFAWGVGTSLQWAWFAIALISGVASCAAAVGTVSSRSLYALIAVDILLISVIWWL